MIPLGDVRSAPILSSNPQFRGAFVMGLSNDAAPRLLMIAKDFDIARSRIETWLGRSCTPLVGQSPDFPWFYRKRMWHINTQSQYNAVCENLLQKVSDSTDISINSIIILEIDFDTPLFPNKD